jgi:hypothetical protein
MMVALLSGVVVAGMLAPAPPASAQPSLTIATDVPAEYPRQVPPISNGQTTRISVVVSSTESVPVTVWASSHDNGLSIADPERSLEPLTGPTTVSFDVAGLTPGFHRLDVEMATTGPPYSSASVSLPYVFTNGSPLPVDVPSARNLWVRAFGYQAPGGPPRMLSLLRGGYFAYVGLPAHGWPTCTHEGSGCVHYWWNTDGYPVIQIGASIVGMSHRGGLYTDGLVPAGPATGTPYGRYDFFNSLFAFDAGHVRAGTFVYSDRSRTSGLIREKVTFFDSGTPGNYRLSYAYADGRKQTLTGRFQVQRGGAITFRDRQGRVAQLGTIFRISPPSPCAVKATCRSDDTTDSNGIWLILSGPKGKHPDGNMLQKVS